MRVAYLCSHYPAISHTFVWREVQALRRLGWDVETLSIHAATPDQLLTEADREAAQTTFSVLPRSAWACSRSTRARSRAGPHATCRRCAARGGMSRPGARGHLWQLFYFVEAIILHAHCARRGVRHIHAHFADVASDVALLVGPPRRRTAGPGASPCTGRWSSTTSPATRLAREGARRAFRAGDQPLRALAAADAARRARMGQGARRSLRRRADRLRSRRRQVRPADEELRVLCVGRLVA